MINTLKTIVASLLMVFLISGPSPAQGENPDYYDSGRLLRVRAVEGDVRLSAGEEKFQAAYENMPLTGSSIIMTGNDSFVEVELSPRSFLRLDGNSEVTFETVAERSILVRYGRGSAYFSNLGGSQERYIDVTLSDGRTIHFNSTGAFRIDEDGENRLYVTVRQGSVTLSKGSRDYLVREGEMASVGRNVKFLRAFGKDTWDETVEARDREIVSARDGYFDHDVIGRSDVNRYGRWVYVAPYGMVWRPLIVDSGWKPYYYGKWVYYSPLGWTWVSSEPWGWVTYHYGSWVTAAGYGWIWVPTVRYRYWYPARVRVVIGSHGVNWYPLRPGQRYVRVGRVIVKKRHRRYLRSYKRRYTGRFGYVDRRVIVKKRITRYPWNRRGEASRVRKKKVIRKGYWGYGGRGKGPVLKRRNIRVDDRAREFHRRPGKEARRDKRGIHKRGERLNKKIINKRVTTYNNRGNRKVKVVRKKEYRWRGFGRDFGERVARNQRGRHNYRGKFGNRSGFRGRRAGR